MGSHVYVMDKYVPKGRKSLPRAHIGYLTDFDATNIYRVWVPHLKRIFRARDVDELVRIIEIPELPDTAQTGPNYVHDHWNDLAQHHGTSPSESPEEGEGVPTPTSLDLRGPNPTFAGSQAEPELLPPAHPVDESQQLQYDLADRLVDTSFRPIASPHSGELEEPPAGQSESQDSTRQKSKHSISADLLTDHIVEGKHTRKPSDRRAVHAAASTFQTQDPTLLFMPLFIC
ncbi:hypothetical protein Egran_04797 [Elaphomyces granulatus]|uniref:Uncharacterized protein n=1 Tax=Elaphomyces granulatus TaxID=519963 RepID=A0A232LTG0_9EURO|nr:hypothetical protein Egran_04797 [Elaphomyces granulatus]